MTWQTIADASAAGPLSRTTLERRVPAGDIATMLDPTNGKRLVWVAPDPIEKLLALVEDLAGELAELRAEVRASSEARGAVTSRPGAGVSDLPREHATRAAI